MTQERLRSSVVEDLIGCATIDDADWLCITGLCEEFDSRWRSGEQVPSIEQHIPSDGDLGLRQLLVRELVLLDIEHRRKRDMSLPTTEYLARLSGYQNAVQSAFAQRSSSIPRCYGSVTIATPASSNSAAQPYLPHANDKSSRYRPTQLHARGGLGAVYRARDEELKRIVALKEILAQHSSNPRYQEKFIFEAEVTGSLEHPGIVPVYGLGRYEDNQPYYAMRFIRGRSFRSVIEEFHEKNPSPSADTYFGRDFRMLLRRLIDACNAIHYAHEHGVLHRDIKPDNVMLGNYGETLVVDWGLAKLIETKPSAASGTESTRIEVSGSGTHTSQGSAVGTPMYMSPEQAHGRHDQLDGRTDVYSLGAVLFNIVTGQHPVEGTSGREIVMNVRVGRIKSVNALIPAAPKALASICRKAMEIQQTDRYPTAMELAEDIDRWMGDEVVQAHIGHERITERAARLIRRYRSWTISGAAALFLITTIAIVAVLLINNAKHKEQVAKLQAVEFKNDAVARYRDARNAIDTWMVQSSDALEFFPETQSIRRRMLQRAAKTTKSFPSGRAAIRN